MEKKQYFRSRKRGGSPQKKGEKRLGSLVKKDIHGLFIMGYRSKDLKNFLGGRRVEQKGEKRMQSNRDNS